MVNIMHVVISRFHNSPIVGFTISRIPEPGGTLASLLPGDDDDPLDRKEMKGMDSVDLIITF